MSKGQATRQEILERAAPVFNRHGFAGASMQDVMQATGFEKGGIYRHFSSKQELAAESFRYALRVAVEARTSQMDTVEGSVNKLRKMIAHFVEVPSPVAGGCPLMNTAIDADDTNPELRALALEGIGAWKQRIAEVVRDGIVQGEVTEETDPGRIANQVVGALEGALMISRIEGSRVALDDARVCLEEMLDRIKQAA